MKPLRFLIYNVILLIALTSGYYAVVAAMNIDYNPVIPFIFVGFLILNQFFLRMLLLANARSPQRFVTAFLGVVAIKLMSAMVFLLVYLMLVDDPAVVYISVALFTAYMSYTILLIRAALKSPVSKT